MRGGHRAVCWAAFVCILTTAVGPASSEPARPAPARDGVRTPEQEAKLGEAAELLKQAEQTRKDGKYAQGVPLVERALKLREEALGPRHPDVASAMSTLSQFVGETGSYDRALELAEKALRLREEILGAKHPDVARSQADLPTIYYQMGDMERARALYERSVEGLTSRTSPRCTSPDTRSWRLIVRAE